MFEGKLPEAREAQESGTVAAPAGELSQLSWSDLVAKLAAARDLRDALGQGASGANGSFDRDSARHLAGRLESWPANGKDPVNRNDLGNGKAPAGIDANRAHRDAPANRGTA